MNVGQLIFKLMQHPQDMEVRVWGGSDCDCEYEANDVEVREEWTHPNEPKKTFLLID